MTKRQRRAAVFATALCAALATAACGSSEKPAASGGSPIPALSDGVLTVATTGVYKPMNFTAEGKLQGYDIDWANILGKELGVKVEFKEGQVAGLLTGLQAGKYDVVMSSLTITDERKKSIDFSVPYVADGLIATKLTSNDAVTDIEHLSGLTVGITSGSGYMSALEKIGGYDELKEYPGSPQAFSDLVQGRIDSYAVGRIPASDYINNQGDAKDPVALAGEPYELLPAGVGIKKGDTALADAINKVIEAKIADGTFDELCKKWFGFTIDLNGLAS